MKIENYLEELLMYNFCCLAGIEYGNVEVKEVTDGVRFRFKIYNHKYNKDIVIENLKKFSIQWRHADDLSCLSLGVVILHSQEDQIRKTLDVICS